MFEKFTNTRVGKYCKREEFKPVGAITGEEARLGRESEVLEKKQWRKLDDLHESIDFVR